MLLAGRRPMLPVPAEVEAAAEDLVRRLRTVGLGPPDRVRLRTPPIMKKPRPSPWHGATSSALVSRSRAMPAGGRRSKPSPRFFTIDGTRFRGPAGRGAGVNTGVPLPAAPSRWLAFRRGCIFTATGRRSSSARSEDPGHSDREGVLAHGQALAARPGATEERLGIGIRPVPAEPSKRVRNCLWLTKTGSSTTGWNSDRVLVDRPSPCSP